MRLVQFETGDSEVYEREDQLECRYVDEKPHEKSLAGCHGSMSGADQYKQKKYSCQKESEFRDAQDYVVSNSKDILKLWTLSKNSRCTLQVIMQQFDKAINSMYSCFCGCNKFVDAEVQDAFIDLCWALNAVQQELANSVVLKEKYRKSKSLLTQKYKYFKIKIHCESGKQSTESSSLHNN